MKILLVEDKKELSDAIKKVLEINKYVVDCGYDGEDALLFVDHNHYDCIIMDIMMPRIDGVTATKRIREKGINTPIIMLTAKAEIEDRVVGLDSGADDYLTKPFALKELLARIRALTRRGVTIENVYTFSNISLDPNTNELYTTNDKKVRLTNKEFKLLECLLRNKNALISSERIMDSVWSFDSEADISVVWVFISSLRKKLEQIGSNASIKAIRGVGYQLIENDKEN